MNGGLRRVEPLAVNDEFVSLCHAAKHAGIVEDQTGPVRAGLLFEEQPGRQAGKPPAHNDTIVEFASVNYVNRRLVPGPIAHCMRIVYNLIGVSRGVAIVPFAGITGPAIGLGKHLDWSAGRQKRCTGSEQSPIEKVAAGYFFVDAEELIEVGAKSRHELPSCKTALKRFSHAFRFWFRAAFDCTPTRLRLGVIWQGPERRSHTAWTDREYRPLVPCVEVRQKASAPVTSPPSKGLHRRIRPWLPAFESHPDPLAAESLLGCPRTGVELEHPISLGNPVTAPPTAFDGQCLLRSSGLLLPFEGLGVARLQPVSRGAMDAGAIPELRPPSPGFRAAAASTAAGGRRGRDSAISLAPGRRRIDAALARAEGPAEWIYRIDPVQNRDPGPEREFLTLRNKSLGHSMWVFRERWRLRRRCSGVKVSKY
jgi:hypothetical protein